MNNDILAINISCIPDVRGAEHDAFFDGVSDQDVAQAMYFEARQVSQSNSLAPQHQKIAMISAALYSDNSDKAFEVWSFGDGTLSERQVLEQFFQKLSVLAPTVVTNNIGVIELLRLRAMIHRLSAEATWVQSVWTLSNAVSNQHALEVQGAASGCGLMGQLSVDQLMIALGYRCHSKALTDQQLWSAWCDDGFDLIRVSSEIEAIKIFLIHQRHAHMKGLLTDQELQGCEYQVGSYIRDSDQNTFWEKSSFLRRA